MRAAPIRQQSFVAWLTVETVMSDKRNDADRQAPDDKPVDASEAVEEREDVPVDERPQASSDDDATSADAEPSPSTQTDEIPVPSEQTDAPGASGEDSLSEDPLREHEVDAEPAAASSSISPGKPKGRILATFAFLFAVAAVAGVGYLYYELIYLNPLATLEQRAANVRADNDVLRNELTTRLNEVADQSRAMAQATEDSVRTTLDANEAAVLESLNEAINRAPPSEREWRLAEAEYLMRIANHRILMEDDSAGALRLLRTADAIITELDDFALHEVRARLADEILALEQVRRDDLQGVYLRLEAVKSELAQLPILTPEYLERAPAEVGEQTVWQVLANELKELVRVRTVDSSESIKPLLAPEEERYLELNLRLGMEQAQLAVLKRHQGVYEHSLDRAREWLVAYLDNTDERTQAVLEEIDELLAVELARDLPDVSGSLTELADLRRNAQ
jgi:uroporphyrin-3 C-methyltransferase